MGPQDNIFQVRNRYTRVFFITILVTVTFTLLSLSEGGVFSEIDNNFLKRYVTQLKSPRLMTVGDVKLEYERAWFMDPESGCSFVVKGDFNKDGYIDYAVIGKYDGPYPDKSIFIAIFSTKSGKVTTEFLYKHGVAHDRGFLCLERGDVVNIRNVDKRFDVIIVSFAYGTDYVSAIAWDGRRYFCTEFEYIPGRYPRKY
ncbi:MAG: hypothetical protein HXY44_01640 [Syntrophaceae bacterium]|nr:hypothetical protein [Syntrophaceae bacterium]